ncbi:MAG: hypothetical protein LBK01_09065 [Burkholderiaceae bacterium]|jgi:hypothetical protein|nr:hypothetical protein [Burkholderiaceae bacterium]
MAIRTITAANSVYMLAVSPLYPVHQRLQGYQADAAFATDDQETAIVQMGVDGHMSPGFVFAPTVQTISLNADSTSLELFDNWYTAQKVAREVLVAEATISIPAIGKKYVMTKGILTRAKPVPDAQRVLAGTTYQISWESCFPSPI